MSWGRKGAAIGHVQAAGRASLTPGSMRAADTLAQTQLHATFSPAAQLQNLPQGEGGPLAEHARHVPRPDSHSTCAGDPAVNAAAMALPALVQQALAHVLEYLKAFGQQTVLRLGSSFQRMQSHMEMALSPNTLQ